MYVISSRRFFWDSNNAASEDRIGFVGPGSFRFRNVELGALQAAVAKQRVLLLVHGYNSDSLDAAIAYKQLRERVSKILAGWEPYYQHVIGYLWAGERRSDRFRQASETAVGLSGRMNRILRDLGGAAVLDVCAHSLGNRIVLGALAAGGARVRNLFCLAPAVEQDALDEVDEHGSGGALRAAAANCDQLYVLHSAIDWVLDVGNAWYSDRLALGLYGPTQPDRTAASVYVVDSQAVVTGVGFGTRHNQYRTVAQTFDLIARASTSRPDRKHFRLDELDEVTWA